MILIGLGGNLHSPTGRPLDTCRAALAALEEQGVRLVRCSPWYETAPVPVSEQPWFVNAVAEVKTGHGPQKLLEILHTVEDRFQRARGVLNGARTLDLDLLAYGAQVMGQDGCPPILPHPRLQDRAFVLMPLCDLAPDWVHPVIGRTAREMAERLPAGQEIRILAGE